MRIRRPRLATGTACGCLIYLLLLFFDSIPGRLRFILSWDAGVLVATLLLIQIRDVSPEVMKRIAAQQDAGKWMVLFLTLVAASASLVAIAGEVPPISEAGDIEKLLRIVLVFGTIVLSWAFIHTIFALHYAHDYYSGPTGKGADKGLAFPGNNAPNYMDFVYFSFTVGMTFQVSDVQITDRSFRGLTLMHGIVSFFYSTVILALTINLMAGLI
ncbi:MAG TPA: DUF1345 domain-containing protein [Burkholderiales bacterium]|nr:DUF1345 domain-containing protein [Burkholderiales bacterium]